MTNGNIIKLPAKQLSGNRRNCTWMITYIRETKKWKWSVTATLQTTFDGIADTEHDARNAVDEKLRRLCQ